MVFVLIHDKVDKRVNISQPRFNLEVYLDPVVVKVCQYFLMVKVFIRVKRDMLIRFRTGLAEFQLAYARY